MAFSSETPACAATMPRSSSLRSSNGTTCSSTSAFESSFAVLSRFLLMSWMTPMTSSRWVMSGTTSIDRVR